MDPRATADQMRESREAQEFRERISPDGKTVKCPHCNELHGLWYRMSSKDKKSLLFTCNNQKQFWYEEVNGRQQECFRTVTKSFQCPVFIDGLDLFVDWSPAKRAEHRKKHQHQLPLMKQ